MKKRTVLLIMLIALALPGTLFAQIISPQYDNGAILGRFSVSLDNNNTIGLLPGAEYHFYQIQFNNGPTIGLGALMEAYIGLGENTTFNMGAFINTHVGLAGVGVPIIENLDFFFGAGMTVMNAGFAFMSGVSYFLYDNMAIHMEYNLLDGNSNGVVGLQFIF